MTDPIAVSQRARDVLTEHALKNGYPLAAASIQMGDDPYFNRVIIDAMMQFAEERQAETRKEERERCAKVAEDELVEMFEDSPEIDTVCNSVVREIAASIRNLGEG